jgi:hypothetical protein
MSKPARKTTVKTTRKTRGRLTMDIQIKRMAVDTYLGLIEDYTRNLKAALQVGPLDAEQARLAHTGVLGASHLALAKGLELIQLLEKLKGMR